MCEDALTTHLELRQGGDTLRSVVLHFNVSSQIGSVSHGQAAIRCTDYGLIRM